MTSLFLYVLAASPDPDHIRCYVPYQVNEKLIFFGACKKRLREQLRKQFLKNSDDVLVDEDLFLVGVNGGNAQHIRKIVWVGRITRAMTFETAFNSLNGKEFELMRSDDHCPILVRPLYDENGNFRGYRSDSLLHKDSWVSDVMTKIDSSEVHFSGDQVLMHSGIDRKRVFNRDCCLLLENIFFAGGSGMEIDHEMLHILGEVQPDKHIDPYAIFGYRADGSVDGMTGRHLHIKGSAAEQLVSLIRAKAECFGAPKSKNTPSNCEPSRKGRSHDGRSSVSPSKSGCLP